MDAQGATSISLPGPYNPEYSRTKNTFLSFRSVSVCNTIWLGFFYTITDIFHRPRNCLIGFFSVLLLVAFSGAVILTIWKVPYILLHLGETSVGEIDMSIRGHVKSSTTINFTDIDARLDGSPEIKGVAPRWLLTAHALNLGNSEICEKNSNRSTRVNILLIDSNLEQRLKIGQGWKHPVNGHGEAHVLESVLDYLKLRANKDESISVQLSMKKMRDMILPDISNIPNTITDLTPLVSVQDVLDAVKSIDEKLFLRLPFKVVDGIKDTGGKYPPMLGNVIVLDYKSFLPVLVTAGCTYSESGLTLPSVLFDRNMLLPFLKHMKLFEHVPIAVVLFSDRQSIYYLSEAGKSKEIVKRSNTLMLNSLGLDFDGIVEFPLDIALNKFRMFRSILTSSFFFVVLGIVVLCVILFLGLLQTIAEERQFEFAMMRTLGMKKLQILVVLMVQLVCFVIPGVFFGVVLIFAFNALLEVFISDFVKAAPHILSIPLTPILLAVGLGLFFPLATGLTFVSKAIRGSLRSALDINSKVQNEVEIIVLKLDELGLSLQQLFLAIFLVFSGFLVYFLVPLSIVLDNVMLFFFLINFVILVMVAGASIVMSVFEPYVETFFLWLMIWREEKRFFTIIKKNLYDHRARNSKAFMMILISVTSIISSSIMFYMLSLTSMQMVCIVNGADITVISNNFDIPLNERELTSFLEQRRSSIVEEYSYQSFPLNSYPHIVSLEVLQTVLGSFYHLPLVTVSKGFLNTVFSDFIIEGSKNMNFKYNYTVDRKYDVIGSMYDNNLLDSSTSVYSIATGVSTKSLTRNISRKLSYVIPAIIGSSITDNIGAESGSTLLLDYKYQLADAIIRTKFKMEVRALMDRLSGFPGMASINTPLHKGNVIIPELFFKVLLNPWTVEFDDLSNIKLSPDAITDIRQAKLFIRLRKNVSKNERFAFVNEIRAILDVEIHSAIDTISLIDNSKNVRGLIMYFFYMISFICIFLCTLMLTIVFTANIRLNSRVIGILRAIGCSKSQLIRINFYEVFSVIFSAFLLGIIVGVLVGVTVGFQLTSVLVLPFTIKIPYLLILVLFILGIVSGIAGSFVSLIFINKNQISTVAKCI